MTSTSWYRRYIFNYRGMREFTKPGYDAASVNFRPDDLDVDCSNRHFMITGSNSGIGYEATLEIAKRGGIIHMVCRNKERATEAQAKIKASTGNDKIFLYILDLSKPREVLEWAKNWAKNNNELHVLINNAGCMVHQRIIDQDDLEFNFATNTLSMHILVTTFIPLLEKNEDSRVITVSSGGMYTVKLDPIDLNFSTMDPFIGSLVYSQNKRQQVVMNERYANRYPKIHFSCMHPGWADTPAVRTSIPAFYEKMKDVLRSASEGADTIVWLAISPRAKRNDSGLFFQDRSSVSTHFPLAWTTSTREEEELLMEKLDQILLKFN